MIDFKTYYNIIQRRIDKALPDNLPPETIEPIELHRAMHYGVLSSGKHLRPLLVYITGESFGAKPEMLDIPAAAIEYIHCFSLIHDDLPAMDNDGMRRGKPACHRVFGEGLTILAGTNLSNVAFKLLATGGDYNPEKRLAMLSTIAKAIGSDGLIGGQALEMQLIDKKIDASRQKQINLLKTGALFRAAISLGAIIANVPNEKISILDEYGKHLGLAFQIQDDIFDRDIENKSKAKKELQQLRQEMDNLLNKLDVDNYLLKSVTDLIMQRDY